MELKNTITLLILLISINVSAQFTDPVPFPQYASDHPVYKKAVFDKTLSKEELFKNAQYILNTYAYPSQVLPRVGYVLLSSETPEKSIIYTRKGVDFSALEIYTASSHYLATLIYGSALDRQEALENYLFALLLVNNSGKLTDELISYRNFYKSDLKMQEKITYDLSILKSLEAKFSPVIGDAKAIYDNYKNFPKENALTYIEEFNDFLYNSYKDGKIPKLSYPILLFYIGKALTFYGLSSDLVDDTYIEVLSEKQLGSNAAFMLAERFSTNNNKKNNRQLVEVLDLVLAKKGNLFIPQQIKLLSAKAMALRELNDFTNFKESLIQIEDIISKVKNPVLRIQALVVLNIPQMVLKNEKAKANVIEMQNILETNPFLKGKYSNVVEQYAYELGMLDSRDDNDKDASFYFNEAQLALKRMDYQSMIIPLEKAKALMDAKRASGSSETLKETILFYNDILTALVGANIKLGQPEKALEYAELFKNKALNDLLNESTSSIKSVKEIQNALAPDEALIYYLGTGTIDNTGVFNFVITKDKVRGGFLDYTKYIAELFNGIPRHIQYIEKGLASKEFRSATNTTRPEYSNNYISEPGDSKISFEVLRSYLSPSKEDLTYQQNGALQVLLNKMWAYLFPNAKFLEGINKLIISPAGDLSFIPFEAFRNPYSGKLLVEDYQISYIPSGSTLVTLKKEAKRSYSKNVLAFGDAKYSLRADKSYVIQNIADVKRLQLKVKTSIKNNENLDYAFASFQGNDPMSYLIGTKNEVEAIQNLVDKTDVRLNTDMTENELKRMSIAGELEKYKILHIASHASVHPYIFELSGIAMSVYPTPKDGEDGIVTIDEMKDLKMNPELVILSACQTGLGRITTGETVQGLNNSLMQAGADATLTSLWSVDDYATSVFIKEFYDRTFNKQISYKEAVTAIKRDFLTGKYGDQLRHPKFWAPFIYYGK
ncbi:CHAT domain-containing protein [Psychroserpens sp.]|uniref:CHAT domain-containing protein n=1 Tax=Psychroserpens sp. TaxID=2020870 RepID=UPI00385992B2